MGAFLGALAVLVTATGALLHAANAAAGRTVEPSFWLMGVAAGLGYGTVAVVVRRTGGLLPGVMAAVGLAQGVAVLASELALAATSGPLAGWATWLGSWSWSPAYVAIVTVLPLLLPDGRLASPRWRGALALGALALVVSSLGWALTPYDRQDFPEAMAGQSNPVGTAAAATLLGPVGGALLVLAVTAAVVSVVLRFRRASGLARQQLKWIVVGVLATVVLMAVSRLVPPELTSTLAAVAMLPLPAVIAVAVLRHGLWDVDVVLSRGLLYVLLGAVAGAGYAVLTAALGSMIGDEAGVATLAAATVSVAVVLSHDAARRRVNRAVYGWEEEPYVVLTRLGDGLAELEPSGEGAGDRGARLLSAVSARVAQGLRAGYVAVELEDGSEHSVGAPVDDHESATVEVPLFCSGERVGRLTVQRPGGLRPAERKVLDRLAGQTAVAARTVLLERAAREAHEQTVLAREEERRRLRHDLHDGIGPSLAALALQVETARDVASDDPSVAAGILDRLVPRLNAAVADVRALVHELRPPTLDELGLASAVRELAVRLSTAGTRVDVVSGDLDRLPAAVEVAAYRIAGEAVTNAVRHAQAARVEVVLRRDPAALLVQVRDDGCGLPALPRPAGVGLGSMRLRAEELGGSLTLTSPAPGDARGTLLRAVLPVPADAEPLAAPTLEEVAP